MREFKYNLIKLIESVKDRPCLWDKTVETYKDRLERRIAWEEIFSMLEKRYPQMSPEDKRVTEHPDRDFKVQKELMPYLTNIDELTGEHIMNKWTNTRDTFIRTLRHGRNGKTKRKYLFHEQLKFLTKVSSDNYNKEYTSDDCQETETKKQGKSQKEGDDNESYEESKPYEYYSIENYVDKSNDLNNSSDHEEYLQPKKRLKREKTSNAKENESFNNDLNFVEIDETNNPRLMNEDEAFFASLLPSIVRYNEDERLEFRIEVLNVMNRIREKQRLGE